MGFRIRQTDVLYKGWSTLYLATLVGDDGVEIRREIEHHGSAAAVLPYDPERRTALLVRQPRPPVIWQGGPDELLEAPAGMLDADDPATCARREAMEEAGVRLTDLEPVGRPYAMPGVSTERIDLYLAPYALADRIAAGGGVAHEHEAITVVETPLAELWRQVEAGEIEDMKTLALVLALKVRHPELF
jgi:nudix-type nucleoside diphosphatase (YffH/AdpP family)